MYSHNMEILLKSYSKIKESKVQIEVEDLSTIGAAMICLQEIQDHKEDYNRVVVRVKSVKVCETETVGDGKKKRDVEMADASDVTTVVLWETDVDKLEEGISYQLNMLRMRSFKGKNHFSVLPCGAFIHIIDDIGPVAHDDDNDDDDKVETLVAATVMGMTQILQLHVH